MQRFRLLGLYLVGVAVVIGLAIGGVSLRRTASGAPPLDAGASPGSPTTTATDAAVQVSIANFAFSPKDLVVSAGATVTWVNADDAAHTVTSKAVPPSFDSRTLSTDDKFSFEFKTPGDYDYFCKAHPYMTGRVIVK